MDKKRKYELEENERKKSKLDIILCTDILLPIEIWHYILSFINWKEISSPKSICKLWYNYFQKYINYFETSNPKIIGDLFPNITDIVITGYEHIDDLKKFTKLKNLTFNGIKPIEFELYKLPIISITWIFNFKICKECLKYTFNEINKSTTIKSLTIKGKNSYCEICKPLYGSLINIEELSMINVEYSNYEILIEIFKLPKLKKLILINTQFIGITNNSFYKIENMKNLQYLEISKNMLNQNSIYNIKKKFNESNKIFILNRSPITYQ